MWPQKWLVCALFLTLFAGQKVIAQGVVYANVYHNPAYGFRITKPEEWTWYVDAARPAGRLLGVWIDENTLVKSTKPLVLIARDSLDTSQSLLTPRIEAKVYELTTPHATERVVEDILQAIEEKDGGGASVVERPSIVEIHRVPWTRLAMNAFVPSSDADSDLEMAQVRLELYLYSDEKRLFLINVLARASDVPTYREEFDGVLQSITITR